jgi:hypothetical protein
MLKSTHKLSELRHRPVPLAEGWTEHKAPTGHLYYYNSTTKQSTYTRPVAPPAPITEATSLPPPINPSQSFLQYQAVGSSIPSAGPTFNNFPPRIQDFGPGRGGYQAREGRGGHDRPRGSKPQPADKPKSRHSIPDCEPWVLVHTKLGRRFVYNTEKDQSFWRIPERLKDGILQLDQLRIKEKAEALEKAKEPTSTGEAPGAAERPLAAAQTAALEDGAEAEDSSEYEEVEVTDDEDEENPTKRQRTNEDASDEPVEFNEDDIAFQLAAMGEDYGLDPEEYDEGHMGDWPEDGEELGLSEEDSMALFWDLLNDKGINPYSPWEKLVEEGKLVDDTRYTALTSMRARKEAWDEWSREKIKHLRDLRAKAERKDPRIPYLSFLQKHANPKLYWPEFKRKYKKEGEMRDAALADKDREKFYRDHIKRLQLPQSTLKSELSALLKAQSTTLLNITTLASHLPSSILADIRYISLDSAIRDPWIEAYISTLPPPPDAEDAEDSEEAVNRRQEKERRQKALDERERHVAGEKLKHKRNLELGKGRLREEEAEIAKAMNVSKKGLMGHLIEQEDAAS